MGKLFLLKQYAEVYNTIVNKTPMNNYTISATDQSNLISILCVKIQTYYQKLVTTILKGCDFFEITKEKQRIMKI